LTEYDYLNYNAMNRQEIMATRTHTIEKKDPQHTQVWEWEETPETIEALKQLQETVKAVNEKKFAGNYVGPLYAPHPDLKNGQKN